MTLVEIGVILLYFGIRFILQVWDSDGVRTGGAIRKYRIVLGVLWLPLETLVYWNSILEDVPCDFCGSPMPVTWYLAWIVFLVTDLLYQFWMLSKSQNLKQRTSEIK